MSGVPGTATATATATGAATASDVVGAPDPLHARSAGGEGKR